MAVTRTMDASYVIPCCDQWKRATTFRASAPIGLRAAPQRDSEPAALGTFNQHDVSAVQSREFAGDRQSDTRAGGIAERVRHASKRLENFSSL